MAPDVFLKFRNFGPTDLSHCVVMMHKKRTRMKTNHCNRVILLQGYTLICVVLLKVIFCLFCLHFLVWLCYVNVLMLMSCMIVYDDLNEVK